MINYIRKYLIKLGYFTKPNFIIIGVQKAGTSALFSILNEHINITGAKKKEIHYFDRDDWYNKNGSTDEYHSHFPMPISVPKKNVLFEATPMYLYHPKVAKRLHEYNPLLKLIILLRDPSYRALSAWTMYHHTFKTGKYNYLHEPRPFKQVIEEEISCIDSIDYYNNRIAYVKRGVYYYQIEKYLNYFDKNQLLFIENSELKYSFENTISDILKFLGLNNLPLKNKFINKSTVNNKSKYSEEIKMLKAFYKPYNTLLFKQINKYYNWN